jgi:hypothetical protein
MLVSGILGDWFLPFLYNIGMDGFQAVGYAWVFLGGLGVIDKLYKQTDDKHELDQKAGEGAAFCRRSPSNSSVPHLIEKAQC